MKFVKLLTAAYVGGALRHPHEGALHVEDAEAERLISDRVAEDVTDDFAAKDNKALPVDSITAPGGSVETSAAKHPHQAEVAPREPEPATKSASRKAAADKE